MAELARLESVYTARYRGFESLSLRQMQLPLRGNFHFGPVKYAARFERPSAEIIFWSEFTGIEKNLAQEVKYCPHTHQFDEGAF